MLHGDDQPLEPLLFGSVSDLIVPRQFLRHANAIVPHWATAERVRRTDGTYSLEIARSTNIVAESSPEKCFVLVATSKSTTHGLVRHMPPGRLLNFMTSFTEPASTYSAEVRRRFNRLRSQYNSEDLAEVLQAKLLIILRLRKRRTDSRCRRDYRAEGV